MNDDLKALYRELGYTGPLDDADRRTTRGGRSDSDSQLSTEYDAPPLTAERLKELEEAIARDPAEALSKWRDEISYPLSDDEMLETVKRASHAFKKPREVLSEIKMQKAGDSGERATRGFIEPAYHIPSELQHYSDIKIDPGNYKYEPKADALGWVFNAGEYWIKKKLKIKSRTAPFPYHDQFDSNFVYPLQDRQGNTLDADRKVTIALFGDFGTGLSHSLYIARKITEKAPDYAFHLGDVYYAGRSREFENYFQKPLDPLLEKSNFFALNANHEMHSGDFPYFAYLNYKKKTRSGWVEQDQEGSYFCVRNAKYQIIGIDTAYHENGRHRDEKLQAWLGKTLREGKAASPKRLNILLSPNQPYKLGNQSFNDLYNMDLHEFAHQGLIDYWFWGNTHYAALFDRSAKTPFIGSCVGHGGHPIYKKDIEEAAEEHDKLVKNTRELPPALWVELSPRFPEHTGIRQEMGNHGFCMMELEGDSVRLTYYDWLGNSRFEWMSG